MEGEKRARDLGFQENQNKRADRGRGQEASEVGDRPLGKSMEGKRAEKELNVTNAKTAGVMENIRVNKI